MGSLDGKVAFITGAGRGQGRSHALRLADEGADIIALDICSDAVSTVGYGLATADDLQDTAAQVEARGRRAVTGIADVRDLGQVQKVVDAGLADSGRSTSCAPTRASARGRSAGRCPSRSGRT